MARVLVIEDEPSVRSAIRAMLEFLGHDVLEAGDGRRGIRVIEVERPDLVICDIVLPETDGLETIGQLRKDQPQLRILAISGKGPGMGSTYVHFAKALGAAEGLTKPVRIEQLKAVVDQLLATFPPPPPGIG